MAIRRICRAAITIKRHSSVHDFLYGFKPLEEDVQIAPDADPLP